MHSTYEIMEYKYKNLNEFRKGNLAEYEFLRYRGLINRLCEDMGWKKPRTNGYWTKELCIEEALKYPTKKHWEENSPQSHDKAKRSGWMGECVAHMTKIFRPTGYWNEERCLEEALKHETRNAWKKACPNSYVASLKKPWRDKCTAHMTMVNKQEKPGFWNKEKCLETTIGYSLRNKWKKDYMGAYTYAKKHGFLDECLKNMFPSKQKPNGHWKIKENCLSEARKYDTKTEWQKYGGGSAGGARTYGFFEECIAHMKK